MPKRTKKQAAPSKFKVGDKIRVKHGVKDVDYPDMPLGGWTGAVIEVVGDDTFTVQWSDETLAVIHPTSQNGARRMGLNWRSTH